MGGAGRRVEALPEVYRGHREGTRGLASAGPPSFLGRTLVGTLPGPVPVTAQDLRRLLTPLERDVLICARHVREGTAGHPDVREFYGGEDGWMDETRAISLELTHRVGGLKLDAELVTRTLANARRKIEGLARQRRGSEEREERDREARIRDVRRQRKVATRRGKRVTFQQDVTREKEVVMDEPTPTCRECGEKVGTPHAEECPLRYEGHPAHAHDVRLSECGDAPAEAAYEQLGEGFADRVAREAQEEAERVLRDLAHVRFRADQVLKVLRALGLPTPDQLEEIAAAALDAELREEPPPPAPETATPEPGEEPPPPVPEAQEPGEQPEHFKRDLSEFPEHLRRYPAAQKQGGTLTQQLKTAEIQHRITERVDRRGAIGLTSTVNEVAQEIPDVRVAAIGDHMRALADAGIVGRTGANRLSAGQTRGRAGVEYESVHAEREEEPSPEPEAAPDEPDPEAWPKLEEVRDAVVRREGIFSPRQVAERLASGEPGPTVMVIVEARLRHLAEQGIVSDESLGEGMPLFEYKKPDGPGRAAELDAERSREAAASNNGTGAPPVPGTGGDVRAGNKEVQEILDAARRAGGNVSKTGSDHYAIENPKNGRRVIIFGTPGAPSRDKNRKKLAGIGLPIER